MTLQVSTGFKSLILAAFPQIFDRGVIKLFAGFRPATSDGEEPLSLIGMVTVDGGPWTQDATGNGLRFMANGPYAVKATWQRWALSVSRSGIPTWGRLIAAATPDTGSVSYDFPRIDFSVSDNPETGAEMILPTSVVQQGQQIDIDSFVYTIPPLYT